MERNYLVEQARQHIETLCVKIPTRRVGSEGNRSAARYLAQTLTSLGFAVETPEFGCMDWESDGATLEVDGEPFAVESSPYSLGVQVNAPLAVATTVAELENLDTVGKVLLVRGEIAREQLFPSNFPFVQQEEHQQIYRALTRARPAALVTATARNAGMTAALYPCPMIEDGDFDVPSVFMSEEVGEQLARMAGRDVMLESRARRIAATGCNVVGRKGSPDASRLLFCAHFDAKLGTPGALDNAAGVTVMLLLAELVRTYDGTPALEILLINGEDYYSAPGEMDYLRRNGDRLQEIMLAVNVDGAGYVGGDNEFSLYECPDELAAAVRGVLVGSDGLTEGEQWYQSDHSVFVMNGRPAVAITTALMPEVWATIPHTPADTPDVVDPHKLVQVSRALGALPAALG
jgi:aminopeptidase YwaD